MIQSCAVRRSMLGVDGEHEYFTQPGRDRTERGFERRGQPRPRFAQPLAHLLARKVNVGSVLEDDSDLRQTVTRYRSRGGEPGKPSHRILDEKAHPLLDFEWGVAGCRRIDDDLHVGDIGHGVDGKTTEVPRPQPRDQNHE